MRRPPNKSLDRRIGVAACELLIKLVRDYPDASGLNRGNPFNSTVRFSLEICEPGPYFAEEMESNHEVFTFNRDISNDFITGSFRSDHCETEIS